MAKVIEKIQRPTLILSHNKTLAAQLYREFKSFFPENRVMAELSGSGPMFFVPKEPPLKSEPAVETKVNGISTAEGEMVVEAQPSAQVGSMPYQATPVITETPKPARRTRKKKVEEAPAETEA